MKFGEKNDDMRLHIGEIVIEEIDEEKIPGKNIRWKVKLQNSRVVAL